MASKKPLNTKEITDLLSKLKAETPEYPSDLLAAKKAAFLKHAVNIKIDGGGQSGESGHQGGSGSSGGSGTALGGGPTTQGFLLQALIGIGIIAAMLSASYIFRDQINDILGGNEVSALEEVSSPSVVSSPLAPVTSSPISLDLTATPSAIVPTGTPTVLDDTNPEITPDILNLQVAEGTGTPGDNGLHLGQTPGTPAAPGHGNPGNENKPDKPTKPPKPPKPNK